MPDERVSAERSHRLAMSGRACSRMRALLLTWEALTRRSLQPGQVNRQCWNL